MTMAKCHAKRKRELGYKPLNKRFNGCHGHHIDNEHVIHIPRKMHKSIYHRLSDPESMLEINKLAFDFLENGEAPKDTPSDPKIMSESDPFPENKPRKIIPLSNFFKTNPT